MREQNSSSIPSSSTTYAVSSPQRGSAVVRRGAGTSLAAPTPAERQAWPMCRLPAAVLRWRPAFIHYHLLYFVVMGLLGSVLLYVLERGSISSVTGAASGLAFMDCIFTAFSALCVTGLISVDTATLSTPSHVVIMLLILAGGSVIASVVPLLVRRHYIHKAVFRAVQGHAPTAERILREEALEYRALGVVVKLVVAYWAVVQLATFLLLGAVLAGSAELRALLANRGGISGWWWALFHSVSAFNNAGFSLFADNLMPMAENSAVLNILAGAIMLGNTAFPLLLRLLVWLVAKRHSEDSALEALLAQPRRFYALLFSADDTAVLGGVFLVLLAAEMSTFLGLDYDLALFAGVPADKRVLAGWFQTVSTRTAGFNCIDVASTAAGMQALWAWLMYLSAYPLLFTIRKTLDRGEMDRQASRELARRDAEVDEVLLAETGAVLPVGLLPAALQTPRTDTEVQERFVYHVEAALADGPNSTYAAPSPQLGRAPAGVVRPATNAYPASSSPEYREEASAAASAAGLDPHPPSAPCSMADSLACVPDDSIGASCSMEGTDGSGHRGSVQFSVRSGVSLGTLISSVSGRAPRGRAADGAGSQGSARQPPSLLLQARALVSRELPFLLLMLLVITIAESDSIATDATRRISVWSILFEVSSAFGTVGLSLGYPGTFVSLSGVLSPFSKMVVIITMLAGRHRGLPLSIDPAVRVPAVIGLATVRSRG